MTIPDKYCNDVLVPVDPDLTENDGWEFARWTINQRWTSKDSYQYYGRSFIGKPQSVYAIRVPNLIIEPIKLAIQELAGDPVWMGTESSTFFGLYPETGCTVFLPESNGYRYYQYSQNSFQNGTARYIKNQWKLHPIVGSDSNEEAFKGDFVFAGKLSDKRKANFKGRRIKQLTALKGLAVEGEILPKDMKEDDLYILTAIATVQIHGPTLNFFNRPGLQPYQYEKPEVIETPKPERIKSKKNKTKKKKIKPKKKKVKKDKNILQTALYLFFFAVIGIMLIYDQKPELLDFIYLRDVEEKSEIINAPEPDMVPTVEQKVESSKTNIPKFIIESQSLISTVIRTLQMSSSQNITLLSIGTGRMDLELVGDKTMDTPIDSLGDVLNYSLRQVNVDSQFKHGYLVKYPLLEEPINQTDISVAGLELLVSSIESSFIKILDPIERGGQSQTPVIVKISGLDNIKHILFKLSTSGQNLALEKFIYVSELEKFTQSAIFYISLFLPPKSVPQE